MFPQFDVTKPNDYEMSFYASADCQSPSVETCKNNADYLAVSVDGKPQLSVGLAGLAATKKWEPFAVKFAANSSSFKVREKLVQPITHVTL